MAIWIPESIDDVYGFDLSCNGEISGETKIHFVIYEYVLKALGLSPDDVSLRHFENGKWVKLNVTYVKMDDGTYYYTALTDSFSPFEVYFEKDSAVSALPSAQPTEAQSPAPILGLLAGVGAAAVLLRRK